MAKKVLYFFTGSFPYNGNIENFINTEFPYLSEVFDSIVIVPLQNQSNDCFLVQDNCKVLKPLVRSKIHHYFFGLFGFRALPLYCNDFFQNKVYSQKERILQFISDFCTTNIILQSRSLKRILKDITQNDIMYFYWGKGLANLIPFISDIPAKKIVRFHGGDLYDCNYGGYIPIHKKIVELSDLSVFISKMGQKYLLTRYPDIKINSVVSYLGTEDFGVSSKSSDGVFRLLSCSNVVPLKRVPLIYDAIQNITDYNVEWTHIGDGPEFGLLEERVRLSRSNIRVNLLGRLPHSEVFNYFRNNPVDVFINVSSTEGLPVSIMEAISFDVPVIGTNTGGTSEIINRETGVLISENPDINEIIDAIEQLRNSNFSPRSFWKSNFSAGKNYGEFINLIQNL